ncbi:MAG: hypothetical protein R3290_05430 [Acidimicrobiia bacterium]|nr:hypothetical protein [Acidimicrobiia bacterium]
MSRSLIAAFAGLVVGLVGSIAVVGAVTDDALPASTSTATTAPTSTTTTTAPLVPAGEARIGPSTVTATELRSDAGILALEYEVTPLTPGGADRGEHGVVAAPARWTLETIDGALTAEPFGPFERTVRFATDTEPADVLEARIDAYWVATPLDHEIVVERSDASWIEVVPDVRVRLLQIVEQGSGFLVIIEGSGDAPSFSSMAVEGDGREWISSSRSMLGSTRWTLDYRGEELPDPLVLTVRGITWLELPADVPVSLATVTRS